MPEPSKRRLRSAGARLAERLRSVRSTIERRREELSREELNEPQAPVEQEPERPDIKVPSDVPQPLKVTAGYAWRIGAIILVTVMILWGLSRVAVVLIPVMIAALLAGLLLPLKRLFLKMRFPNGLATFSTLLAFAAALTGVVWLVVATMADGAERLWSEAITGINSIRTWLATGPLQITDTQITDWAQEMLHRMQENSQDLLKQAASVGTTVTHFLTGLLLTVFALIFFLLDGAKIWKWTVGLFPRHTRAAADGAGRRGWGSLVSYIRVQVIVALIDGFGIGLGAFILNVPLAPQLGVLVFLGAFIPIVGAFLTGAIAVLIALVAQGWVVALIMLGVVLFVQQVESHVLQPLIMGRAVSLHPLAVVLVVACGTFLFGIAGALFSVPLIAIINSVGKYLAAREWERDPAVAHRRKEAGQYDSKAEQAPAGTYDEEETPLASDHADTVAGRKQPEQGAQET